MAFIYNKTVEVWLSDFIKNDEKLQKRDLCSQSVTLLYHYLTNADCMCYCKQIMNLINGQVGARV